MYDHTQTGWVIIWTVGGFALLCILFPLFVDVPDEGALLLYGVTAILFLALFLFYSLRVTVDGKKVRLAFGPGLIHKTFPIEQIVSANVVTNSWLCGWGIYWCGGSTLYNVSGWYAVEIEMTDGGKARIGTDEPDRLTEVIRNAQAFLKKALD